MTIGDRWSLKNDDQWSIKFTSKTEIRNVKNKLLSYRNLVDTKIQNFLYEVNYDVTESKRKNEKIAVN